MIKRAKIDWTVRQLCKNTDSKMISLEHIIQRGLVWDIGRKSLLIHTVLSNFPIPEFWMSKNESIYYVLDGKQRHNALYDFINNKYALRRIPLVELEDSDMLGKSITVDLNGKKFQDLDKELQDDILNYKLEIHYFEDISSEQTKEIFFRLNNGKPLSASDITKVKAKSLDKIVELADHPIFDIILTEKARNVSTDIDIIMKSYVILFSKVKSLENKKTRSEMENSEYTDAIIATITGCYDTILNAYMFINDKLNNKEFTKDEKANYKKIMKRVATKTHFVTMLEVVNYVVNNNIDSSTLAGWLLVFFNSMTGTTISEEYNKNAMTGSSYLDAVTRRRAAMMSSFLDFIGTETE